jgi:hypothetical protein
MILLFTCFGSAIHFARAKNIDYSPDFTDDGYWDTHYILVVRVTDVRKDEAGALSITYHVVVPLSEAPPEGIRTVPSGDLWFGRGFKQPPSLAVNNNLVICFAKQGRSPIVTTKLETSPTESQLVKRLLRISGLRRNEGGLEALTEGVFDQEQVIALYCLKRLLSGRQFPPPAGYVGRLLDQRDNPVRDSQVRLLTSDLVSKAEGKPPNSEDNYLWLRAAVEQSKAQDWTQLRPFVDRLLDFGGKRAETVAFLCGLATDGRRAEAIRIAAYSTFDDSRLFHFARPDAESDMVFNACVEMVKDPKPVMRRAGVALVYNISVRINPEAGRNYVVRAKAAIAGAMSVEGDEGTRSQMKMYLDLLSHRG